MHLFPSWGTLVAVNSRLIPFNAANWRKLGDRQFGRLARGMGYAPVTMLYFFFSDLVFLEYIVLAHSNKKKI